MFYYFKQLYLQYFLLTKLILTPTNLQIMTDNQKINEEIRNYKLFKIQRIRTKIQNYSEILSDIEQFKKSHFATNALSYFNYIAPVIMLFLISKNSSEPNGNYEGFLYFILLIFIINAVYQSYHNVLLRKKFGDFEEKVKDTIDHFQSESEKQITNYEFFIEELQKEETRFRTYK